MPETDARAQNKQPLGLGRSRRLGRDAEFADRPPEQHGIADRLGGSDQQELLRLLRKLRDLAAVAGLDPAWESSEVGWLEPRPERRSRQTSRQLEQRQRIAARLSDDSIANTFVQRADCSRGKQLACIGRGQPLKTQLGQSSQLVLALVVASREDKDHGLGLEAPRNERQHLARRT